MFNKKVLDSGLRLLTQKLEGTKSVTILVLAGAGSRYETQKIRGIAHFLEHMFFKGAERFKNTKEVSEAIDSVGGEFNAFTGKEYVGYYVKVASENKKLAFDVLSDMLINSKFDQAEIEKERGVIMEEYNMYQDTPMYQIGWNFENLVFGDQPLGWDQIGTKKLIKGVMTKDFVDYKNKLYTSDNLVIAVAGDIDFKECDKLTSKYFNVNKTEKQVEFKPLENVETKSISLVNKKTNQAHLAVGFPSYSSVDDKYYALKLLSVILGGNMSSRMFLSVREAKGLSYYIKTSVDAYLDGGAISTSAGVDLERIDDAISSIVLEYKKIAETGVTEPELKKAKSYLKGKMTLGLEDSEEYCHLLAKNELLKGKAKTVTEIFKDIDAVNLDAVNAVAAELFIEDKLKLAVIGPFDDESRFKKLLKF